MEYVSDVIFTLVSSPWFYLIAALISFSYAYRKVAIKGAGIRNFQMAQLYFLFGVVFLAFAGILWRMAHSSG